MPTTRPNAYTYTSGPSYRAERALTKGALHRICTDLAAALGEDAGEATDVSLERITEGGLLVHQPSFPRGAYKSLRLGLFGAYPIVEDGWRDAWRDSSAVIVPAAAPPPSRRSRRRSRDLLQELPHTTHQLASPPQPFQMMLKAFYGATPWTINELQHVEQVFARHGLVVQKRGTQQGPLPKRLLAKLVSYGALGAPHADVRADARADAFAELEITSDAGANDDTGANDDAGATNTDADAATLSAPA